MANEPAPVRAADPHRPRVHFLPPAGWINDPNGPIRVGDGYHLFYQHNPHGAFWGTMHWGHAKSRDLVRWEHLPIVLVPGPEPYDADGVFSGCCVLDGDAPSILYTGVRREGERLVQTQCLATGDAGLVHWRKHPRNPVIAAPPVGLDLVSCWRDPYVWREDDGWRMLIGSGLRGVGGAALLYRSDDLLDWRFLHPLWVDETGEAGHRWECPLFFPLGDRHVLIVSTLNTALWFLGRFERGRFSPERRGRLDLGNCFYAPNALQDADGRRIAWGWSWEKYDAEAVRARGWAGCLSLPREVFLTGDGGVGVRPARELETLRRRHRAIERVALRGGRVTAIEALAGERLELEARFAPGDARRVGLSVRRSSDGEEETRIVLDLAERSLIVDAMRSSLDARAERFTVGGPVAALRPGEPCTLHAFLDGSILEVFLENGAALTTRIYPSRDESLGVAAFAEGGTAVLERLDAWISGCGPDAPPDPS